MGMVTRKQALCILQHGEEAGALNDTAPRPCRGSLGSGLRIHFRVLLLLPTPIPVITVQPRRHGSSRIRRIASPSWRFHRLQHAARRQPTHPSTCLPWYPTRSSEDLPRVPDPSSPSKLCPAMKLPNPYVDNHPSSIPVPDPEELINNICSEW